MLLGLCPFDRLHLIATTAFAGTLTDRIAVTIWSTCTGIFPFGREHLFLAVYHYSGLVFFNFGDFGLDQIFAANAFACVSGHGQAGTAIAASTNVDLISHFEINLTVFERCKGDAGHSQT